jgi:D-glycero-alpha-D-manno-heptose-7-phosphate kinase
LNGLHALLGEPATRRDLAEEACEIELNVLNKPIGKQDQYMAAFGGLTVLDISTGGKVQGNPLPVTPDILEALEQNILLFYTGIARDALEILGEQSSQTKSNNTVVVDSLHYIKDIGFKIKEALVGGNLRKFGELLDMHWVAKKKLSTRISNGKIDEWYDLAKANGAVGGKVSGAGGGGFLLVYCDTDKRRLRDVMKAAGLTELRFRFDFEGSKIIFNMMPSEKRWVHAHMRSAVKTTQTGSAAHV